MTHVIACMLVGRASWIFPLITYEAIDASMASILETRPGVPRTYVSRHLQVILILNIYTLIFTRARCTHTSRNDGTVLFACIVEHINMPLLNDSDPIQKGSQRRYMFPTQFENGKSSRDK